jgi:hypothetical protein
VGDLATGYILGQMAEGYFKGMEETAVAVMSPRLSAAQQRIDVGALLAENQALRNDNAHLQAINASVEEYANQLRAWGRSLYDELVKIKGR